METGALKTRFCRGKNCLAINPQPLSEFGKWRDGEDGRSHHCKTCSKEYTKKTFERRKVYRQANKDNRRNHALQQSYGITLETYNQILLSQNESCAICNKHKSLQKNHFAVDHNHVTGKVRGLLCDPCNLGIGQLKCDVGIETIQKAIEYIKSHS